MVLKNLFIPKSPMITNRQQVDNEEMFDNNDAAVNLSLNTGNNDDPALRPKFLKDYVGQEKAKNQIKILVESAKKREAVVDHVLIHGFQGLGKTTLAQIIASEMNSNIIVTSGQAITKIGDMAAMLNNLQEGDILFIDEIHRIKPNIEEMLYTAMEDFVIDIVLGKGPTAKTMRLDLPRFTLVGATTKFNSISGPLRDRFGCNLKLSFYEVEEVKQILLDNARKLDLNLSNSALDLLSSCSRRTPRIANNLLRRVRDYAIVEDINEVEIQLVQKTLDALGVNNLGLNITDTEILRVIYNNFESRPVGLSTLAAALNEEKDTIENIHEPFLIQLGFLQRTHRGRLLTPKGIKFTRTVLIEK